MAETTPRRPGRSFAFNGFGAPGAPSPNQALPPVAEAPVAPVAPQQNFDINALMQAFLQSQNQANLLRQQGDREARSGRHLDMSGQDIVAQPSPFGGPIQFEDAATRYAKMQNYARPAPGMIPPRTDFDSNPYAFGELPSRPAPQMPAPAPTPGSWVPSLDDGMDHVGGIEPGKRDGYIPPMATGQPTPGPMSPAIPPKKKPAMRSGASFGFAPSRPNFSAGISY